MSEHFANWEHPYMKKSHWELINDEYWILKNVTSNYGYLHFSSICVAHTWSRDQKLMEGSMHKEWLPIRNWKQEHGKRCQSTGPLNVPLYWWQPLLLMLSMFDVILMTAMAWEAIAKEHSIRTKHQDRNSRKRLLELEERSISKMPKDNPLDLTISDMSEHFA